MNLTNPTQIDPIVLPWGLTWPNLTQIWSLVRQTWHKIVQSVYNPEILVNQVWFVQKTGRVWADYQAYIGKQRTNRVWFFLRSYFFKNEPLISCPLLSSKLDSPAIKTLERHSLNVKKSAHQCFDFRRIWFWWKTCTLVWNPTRTDRNVWSWGPTQPDLT